MKPVAKFYHGIVSYFFSEDVFISYSREDGTDYALELSRRLDERKVSSFLDNGKLVAEDNYTDWYEFDIPNKSKREVNKDPSWKESKVNRVEFSGGFVLEKSTGDGSGIVLKDAQGTVIAGFPGQDLFYSEGDNYFFTITRNGSAAQVKAYLAPHRVEDWLRQSILRDSLK